MNVGLVNGHIWGRGSSQLNKLSDNNVEPPTHEETYAGYEKAAEATTLVPLKLVGMLVQRGTWHALTLTSNQVSPFNIIHSTTTQREQPMKRIHAISGA